MRLSTVNVEAEDAFRVAAAARMAHLGRIAYGLCGDRHLAQDMVQTALVRLYVAWPLREPGAIDAWLRQTMVRSWIDTTRRSWWQREHSVERLPDVAVVDPDVSDSTDLRTVDLPLAGLLSQLPPRQRACIILRFLQDLSVEQTAATLGCSTGTVKSSTSRGLATIRLHLHEERQP